MFSSLPKVQGHIKRKDIKRWWLFDATDFQSLMYPCFTFCRILGIFPYKINASVFEISTPYYLFSIIVKCVICTLIIIMNYSGLFSDLNESRYIENICAHMLYNFIMIVTFVSNGPRKHLLQTILQISSRLPSEMYRKQSMLIHSKDIIGFVFLIVYSLTCYYYAPVSALIEIYFLYVTLLVFQIDMLYINCVCVLKTCFKRINSDLANLLINDESHVVKWIKHEQGNPLLLMELKALKKEHLIVSEAVQKLNITFCPHLLATIALNFIHITFEIFLNMIQWKNGLSISWINETQHVSVPYIVCLLIKIALIAWACETGKNQAKKINTTVHDVLNSTDDKKIKSELHVFSLQVMHHNITFSAKSLIVDATLIIAMTDTITTYILILIQFLMSLHSCEGRTTTNLKEAI